MKSVSALLMALLALAPTASSAVTGDLNGDGVVSFDDFFIFADNFGRSGLPEATVVDTVIQTLRDTVIIEVASEAERPQIQSSWSGAQQLVRPSVYWLGYTARSTDGTLYEATFVGTGWAITESLIATNYHVGLGVDQGFKLVRSDLEPIMIAVKADTRLYGSDTRVIGAVSADRDLMGWWDPRYDNSVSSPDIAFFGVEDPTSPLEPAVLAPDEAIQGMAIGDEIAILGFPQPVELAFNVGNINSNPTLKTGIVSTFRPYDGVTTLSSAWISWLMGKVVQHNLETSPGNSGSPIFNRRGEVVAIHNAGLNSGDAFDFGIRGDEIRALLRAVFKSQGLSHANAKPVGGFRRGPHPRPR